MKKGKYLIAGLFLIFAIRLIAQTINIVRFYEVFGYDTLSEKTEIILELLIVLVCTIFIVHRNLKGYAFIQSYSFLLFGLYFYELLIHREVSVIKTFFPLTILAMLNLKSVRHEFGIIDRMKPLLYSLLLTVVWSVIFYLILHFH